MLMTDCSSFELENKQQACYLAMTAWLSKYCHGFSTLFGPKMNKYLRKR